MAASKPKTAGVQHVVDANGDHHIGVKVDGVFVPFASLAAYRVAQLVENGGPSADNNDESDEGGDA